MRDLRHNAATIIQTAFRQHKRLVRQSWDQLIYIHVHCAATVAEDELYRSMLQDQMDSIHVNVRWVETFKLGFGPRSFLRKAIRDIPQLGQHVMLVIGSHGLLASGQGFTVVEDMGRNGIRAKPTHEVVECVREIWRDIPLFMDSCYSKANAINKSYDGHVEDPLYTNAGDAVSNWAELQVLERCASALKFE